MLESPDAQGDSEMYWRVQMPRDTKRQNSKFKGSAMCWRDQMLRDTKPQNFKPQGSEMSAFHVDLENRNFPHSEKMIHRLSTICKHSAQNSASFDSACDDAIAPESSQICDWPLI